MLMTSSFDTRRICEVTGALMDEQKSRPRFHADGFSYIRLSADHSTTAGKIIMSVFFVVDRRTVVSGSNRSCNCRFKVNVYFKG